MIFSLGYCQLNHQILKFYLKLHLMFAQSLIFIDLAKCVKNYTNYTAFINPQNFVYI